MKLLLTIAISLCIALPVAAGPRIQDRGGIPDGGPCDPGVDLLRLEEGEPQLQGGGLDRGRRQTTTSTRAAIGLGDDERDFMSRRGDGTKARFGKGRGPEEDGVHGFL